MSEKPQPQFFFIRSEGASNVYVCIDCGQEHHIPADKGVPPYCGHERSYDAQQREHF